MYNKFLKDEMRKIYIILKIKAESAILFAKYFKGRPSFAF